MKYIALGSGSRGNSTLVVSGDSAVLIDCGFSRRILFQRFQQANFDPEKLRGLFVTHEHADHAKGVQTTCESLQIPFYSSFGTAQKMGWLSHPQWQCITADDQIDVDGLFVNAVVVPHDSLEPLQFSVSDLRGVKLGILSDLGTVTPHLVKHYRGCHGLQIEANHDVEMLNNGPYPPQLRARVAGNFGHLNNHQCADFIRQIQWPGLVNITAGHISEKNNDRRIVQNVLADAIGCTPDQVTMLEQDVVSPWFELPDDVLTLT